MHLVSSKEERKQRAPQPSEECTTRRVLKGLGDGFLKLPISSTPDTYRAIVRLSCEKFTNRIPADSFDEALVQIQFC